jgi:hypothetical protein
MTTQKLLAVRLFGALVLAIPAGSSNAASSPRSGNQCKKAQLGQTISGLTCQKQGTKNVWSRVVSESAPQTGEGCDPNYEPCVPIASDVDCAGGTGNGPAYVKGPVRVIGVDIYGLDRDGNRIGCERS